MLTLLTFVYLHNGVLSTYHTEVSDLKTCQMTVSEMKILFHREFIRSECIARLGEKNGH